MTTPQFFLTAWRWDFFGLVICLAAVLLRCALAGILAPNPGSLLRPGLPVSSHAVFAAGLAVLIIALFSPLRVLAESYLFSAHMLQHLLLLLVVPPLFLASLPQATVFLSFFRRPQKLRRAPGREAFGMRRLAAAVDPPKAPATQAISRPPGILIALAWLAGVGAMWFWHIPALCDAATTSPAVFHLQFLSLLGLGTFFWLPICGPVSQRRLPPLTGILYLFSACLGCTLLGIYITFTPLTVCSIYAHPADPLHALPLIRAHWGLDHAADQRLGGLLMWVPACTIYLAIILGLLARWYAAASPTAPPADAKLNPKHT